MAKIITTAGKHGQKKRDGNSMFDVVLVPDFAGKAKQSFEVRTLFFLASWLENAGESRNFPLHLACIGPPPSSVRWLAEKCGAQISVHEPIHSTLVYANKLRGLEVSGQTEKVLLLDTDILVLTDLSSLSHSVEHYSISVAPTIKPFMPDKFWAEIYTALGIGLTKEYAGGINEELGLKMDTGSTSRNDQVTFPYFNSGVVFCPWSCRLREVWVDHIHRIRDLLREKREPEWMTVREHRSSSQPGLTTAIIYLKRQGVPFSCLPDPFHGLLHHIYSRGLRFSEITLLHMINCFRNLENAGLSCQKGISSYQWLMIRRFSSRWSEGVDIPSKLLELYKCMLPALMDVYRIGRLLRDLHHKYVSTALGI